MAQWAVRGVCWCVQCTMYNVQCTMYNAQCTMYNVQCTMGHFCTVSFSVSLNLCNLVVWTPLSLADIICEQPLGLCVDCSLFVCRLGVYWALPAEGCWQRLASLIELGAAEAELAHCGRLWQTVADCGTVSALTEVQDRVLTEVQYSSVLYCFCFKFGRYNS